MSYESTAEPIKIGYLMDFLLGDYPKEMYEDLTIPFDMVFQDAFDKGLIDRRVEIVYREVEGLLASHGLPVSLDPSVSTDGVMEAMERDKKQSREGLGFVLLSEPGEPSWGQLVEADRVRAVVEELK